MTAQPLDDLTRRRLERSPVTVECDGKGCKSRQSFPSGLAMLAAGWHMAAGQTEDGSGHTVVVLCPTCRERVGP